MGKQKNFTVRLTLEEAELIEHHCRRSGMTKQEIFRKVMEEPFRRMRLLKYWEDEGCLDDDDEPAMYSLEQLRQIKPKE